MSGTFKLQMGNSISSPLTFNATNPAAMVASLQTAINTLAGGTGGVQVTYSGKVNGNPTFQVTFAGSYVGVIEPLLQAAANNAMTYRGTISAVNQTGDSVTNPANYLLYQGSGNTLVPGGVVSVQYGLNEASVLAAEDPTDYGDLNVTPSNRYEAVLTFASNDAIDGVEGLGNGTYTVKIQQPIVNSNGVTIQNGLRSSAMNALGENGFQPAGASTSQQFSVLVTAAVAGTDNLVSGTTADQTAGYSATSGTTYPETPHAVAVTPDGDQIVVWTATDPTSGHTRVYFQMYDASGSTRHQLQRRCHDGGGRNFR